MTDAAKLFVDWLDGYALASSRGFVFLSVNLDRCVAVWPRLWLIAYTVFDLDRVSNYIISFISLPPLGEEGSCIVCMIMHGIYVVLLANARRAATGTAVRLDACHEGSTCYAFSDLAVFPPPCTCAF
jgi:hypothetical protein